MLSPRAFGYRPGPGPAPPTARFGPGYTNPPPLPSSSSRATFSVTYVLPQKDSFPAPPLGLPPRVWGPTLGSGRKAALPRLRAAVRGRVVAGPRLPPRPEVCFRKEEAVPGCRATQGRAGRGGSAPMPPSWETRDFPRCHFPVGVEVVSYHRL